MAKRQSNTNGNGWLKFLVALGVILISAAVAYGILNEKVCHTEKEMEALKPRMTEVEKAVTGIQHDLKYIKSGIDRLEGRDGND